MPVGYSARHGLLRPAVKWLLWFGPPNCYRNQEAVLWEESTANRLLRMQARLKKDDALRYTPSGHHVRALRMTSAAERRGGVTPFNVLVMPNPGGRASAGAYGHGAGTPMALVRWWIRYICPPGGVVLDPFGGSGTTAIAAMREGRRAVLIERIPGYVEMAKRRVAEEKPKPAAQPGSLFR